MISYYKIDRSSGRPTYEKPVDNINGRVIYEKRYVDETEEEKTIRKLARENEWYEFTHNDDQETIAQQKATINKLQQEILELKTMMENVNG